MSRDVQEAAQGSAHIAGTLDAIARSAQAATHGVDKARHAATALAELAAELRGLVDQFQTA